MTRTIACERTELLMSIIGGISSVFRDHFSILLNLLILPFVVMRAPQPILIILHSPSLTFSLNPSLLLNIFVLIPVFSSATNAGGEIESSIVLNKGNRYFSPILLKVMCFIY